MTTQPHDAAGMVDLNRYPMIDPESAEGASFAQTCRREYAQTGLCMLPEFILPAALKELTAEATACSDTAYFCKNAHNVYLTDETPGLAADDIARRQEQTYVGSVPYDRIDPASRLNALYQWDALSVPGTAGS